jgi:DNA-3-methyladenine glycosylase
MIPKSFFERNAVKVAKDLIGCFLCTRDGRHMIVETEAYEGVEDRASHASRGKTDRNQVMFGDPGRWYIYFTYGMHYMLNIVCGKKGHPAAVLIRGVVNAIGPGRLTKKLEIDKKLNGKKLSKTSGFWIEYDPTSPHLAGFRGTKEILKTPRIGVDFAGSVWSKKRYRFVLEGYETKKFKNYFRKS